MSCQKKDTAPQVGKQATKLIDKEWEEEVLTRIPAETEEQAFRFLYWIGMVNPLMSLHGSNT